MKIFHKIHKISNVALALGFFDGIHIGHRKILSDLVEKAKSLGVKTGVITFQNNPSDYFSKSKTPLIQNSKDKELIMKSIGIDYLFELDFEKYKAMKADDYLKDVLIENFKPPLIIVGYNHTFGKNRLGTPKLLKDYEKKYNYKTIIIPEQKSRDSDEISSSVIRKKISQGKLDKINELLERDFSVRNTVIKGDNKASKLGYPTANIIWPESMAKLPFGVYFGFVQINKKSYHALISWGNKPTLTNGKNEIIEAHLYRFNKNIYGKMMNVIFVKKLRDQKKFDTFDALKAQIQKDYDIFIKWAEDVK